MNYYNENDPFAAEWLRNLIKKGLISLGEVDERSIKEVQPEDLKDFKQCHFFAGIGVWSYALKQAGWSDDVAVWTGSCPCQSFSAAGQRKGFKDERHLWPDFFRLIRECRPATVFGEQVSSKDALIWLDLVQDNLEDEKYAFGAIDCCAAGVGAPHIRQRLYWVADSVSTGRPESRNGQTSGIGSISALDNAVSEQEYTATTGRFHALSSKAGRLGHSDNSRSQGRKLSGTTGERQRQGELSIRSSGSDDLDNASNEGFQERSGEEISRRTTCGQSERSGYVNGYWQDAEWLYCRDGKYRPSKPEIFPLVDGPSTNRVGILRGAGNALVAPQAQAFIEAFMESAMETKA